MGFSYLSYVFTPPAVSTDISEELTGSTLSSSRVHTQGNTTAFVSLRSLLHIL